MAVNAESGRCELKKSQWPARGSAACAGRSAPCSSPPRRSTTWTAQVSGLLKPTLMKRCQHGIGMTEVDYGTIMAALHALLCGRPAGRGTVCRQGRHAHRLHGHHGRLEPFGHGPCAGQLSAPVRHCALLPRARRIRQLSRRHQNRRRVVSAERAFAGHRHLQLRRKHRRHPGSADRALGHAFTLDGTRPFWSPASSAHWILSVVQQIPQALRSPHPYRR